eukprot:EG_transcript_4570
MPGSPLSPLMHSHHPTYCNPRLEVERPARWTLWLCISCAAALLASTQVAQPFQFFVTRTPAGQLVNPTGAVMKRSHTELKGSSSLPDTKELHHNSEVGVLSGLPETSFSAEGSWAIAAAPLLMGLFAAYKVVWGSPRGVPPPTAPQRMATVAVTGAALPLGTPLAEVVAAELAGTGHEAAAAVVGALDRSCQRIAQLLARANIVGVLGSQGTVNVQGEEQKQMDVISNDILKDALADTGLVGVVASEEEDTPVTLPAATPRYAVAFDPLDGSSNIDCSLPTGTIFSIYDTGAAPDSFSFLGPMDRLLISGYALYSSSTSLVITCGKGTHLFTLDPEKGQFVLTKAHITVPTRGPFYSLNDGRSFDWPEGLQRYIADIKQGKGQWGKKYGARYVCSLVADIHRTLLYGGWAGNPRPHLRLLFESAPLSYVLEQAGGAGSDGKGRILGTTLTALHQRSPLFAGSAADVAELESYGDVQQGAQKYD